MTCSDAMTTNPKCCYPTDTVVRAAQIMREEDIGPVPVIDQSTRRLVGLVTDRDIAINVVASGREPHAVDVQDIMSESLITCNPEDDYGTALQSMADHQVRRIPVVNDDGSLAGIISQADVARHSNDDELGHMVEEISDASIGASPIRMTGNAVTDGFRDAGSSLLCGAACFTLGAAAMYLLDPERGRIRRSRTRNTAMRLYNDSAAFAGKAGRDLKNRTSGTFAGIRGKFHQETEEDVPEGKLVARVRSRMGHLISHPHAIQVSARGGEIILDGDILADDLTTLLSAARSVPGVTGIDNRLKVHETAEHISSLQSGADPAGERWEVMKDNWSPGIRVLASALGGCLAFYGLKTSGPAAKTAGTLGLGLLARGITNTAASSWIPTERLRQIH